MVREWLGNRVYLVVAVVAVSFLLIGYFGGSYGEKDRIGKLTEEIRKEATEQYRERISGYEKILTEKDKRNVILEKEKKAALAIATKLLKEREDVKPPQTKQELIDRLGALGLEPSSVR